MLLKIDLHVHTWYSDSSGSPKAVIKEAQRKGLDGIAITDHNTVKGAYEALEERDRLIIIIGEEVKTKQGEILALGIKTKIPKKLSPIDTIDRIHAQGGLAIIPHPTVPFFSKLKEKEVMQLPIDGLEAYSAVVPFPKYFFKKNVKLARRLGKPIVGGSDSHHQATVGDAYTLVDSDSRDLDDILQAIRLGRTEIVGNSSGWFFKLVVLYGIFKDVLMSVG